MKRVETGCSDTNERDDKASCIDEMGPHITSRVKSSRGWYDRIVAPSDVDSIVGAAVTYVLGASLTSVASGTCDDVTSEALVVLRDAEGRSERRASGEGSGSGGGPETRDTWRDGPADERRGTLSQLTGR